MATCSEDVLKSQPLGTLVITAVIEFRFAAIVLKIMSAREDDAAPAAGT